MKNNENNLMANFSKLCQWEQDKVLFLCLVARDLEMNISGYGIIDVNPNSGYTYLWLEDYMFTLYMPISCELKKADVWASWTDSYDGREEEMRLTPNTSLRDLEMWADNLNKVKESEEN